MFVDLSKSWEINDSVVMKFFPCLRRGSCVIQQDYMFFRNPWVAHTMYLLRDLFEFGGNTDYNSMIFYASQDIGRDDIEKCLHRNFRVEMMLEAFEWSRSLVSDYRAWEMVEMMRISFLKNPEGLRHGDFSHPGIPKLGSAYF